MSTHRRYLSAFVDIFRGLDVLSRGLIDEEGFRAITQQIDPNTRDDALLGAMLEQVDPHSHQVRPRPPALPRPSHPFELPPLRISPSRSPSRIHTWNRAARCARPQRITFSDCVCVLAAPIERMHRRDERRKRHVAKEEAESATAEKGS